MCYRFKFKKFHYELLARKICKLFSTAGIAIYYVEPKTEGLRQKISKGEIPDSFRNKVRILRNLEIIPGKRKLVDSEVDDNKLSKNYDGKQLKKYLSCSLQILILI